jgi:hypothetical protein
MLQGLISMPVTIIPATIMGKRQLNASGPETTVVLTAAPASVLMATLMRAIPWDASV